MNILSFSLFAFIASLCAYTIPAAYSAPFPAQFEPRLMLPEEGRQLGGSESHTYMGERTVGIGDINNDGFADFVVGGHNEGSSFTSYHILIYGSSSTDSLNFDSQTIAEQGAVYIDDTWEVTAAGDVNADGFDDWVYRSGSSEYALVAGQAEPYASSLNILDPATAGVARITNSAVEDEFPEWRITATGDMNGDGIDDLVVDDDNYLWFIPGRQDNVMPAIDLADYTRHQVPGWYFEISSNFDINNDGFNDLLIGMDEAEFYEGQVILLFGGTTPYPDFIERATLNGQNGLIIESSSAEHGFRLGGEALLTQDVNGDSIDDFLLSADEIMYVLYGSERVWPAYLDLDQIETDDGYTVSNSGGFWQYAAALGDVNSDNLADWAVEIDDGVQVIYGYDGPRENMNLSSLDSADGFILKKTAIAECFCSAADYSSLASNLGDVNGDGVDDILLGYEYDYSTFDYIPGMSQQEIELQADRYGIAYLVFGRAAGEEPNSPSDLQAALGPELVELRWQAPQGTIDSYEIWRNGELLSRIEGDQLFYLDEEVLLEATYEYAIVAVKAELSSSPLKLIVENLTSRYPSISGIVYSQTLAEIFWAYENAEYTIYRNNIPVDERWAASYLDYDYSPDGNTYHVSVASADSASITLRSRTLQLPEESGVQPPQVPENLSFRIYSDSTLELFWEQPEGGVLPLHYSILSGDSLIGTTDGTSIMDRTLDADGHLREYEIFAIDSIGNQSPPARLTIEIDIEQQKRKPAQAVDFVPNFIDSSTLELTWQLNELGTPPTSFQVRRNGTLLGETDKLSFTDKSVSENQRYDYYVTSIGEGGIRSDSVRFSVATPGGPFAPKQVTTAVYGPNLVEVFWSRAEGAMPVLSYDVYRDGEFLLNTPFLSYLDNEVQPDTTYNYSIVSVADDSRSEPTAGVETVVFSMQYWIVQ